MQILNWIYVKYAHTIQKQIQAHTQLSVSSVGCNVAYMHENKSILETHWMGGKRIIICNNVASLCSYIFDLTGLCDAKQRKMK